MKCKLRVMARPLLWLFPILLSLSTTNLAHAEYTGRVVPSRVYPCTVNGQPSYMYACWEVGLFFHCRKNGEDPVCSCALPDGHVASRPECDRVDTLYYPRKH
jgi:hypothetical protein